MEFVAANDDKTELEMEIAAYNERQRIDDALVQHIANRMASPCIPHYDHIRNARKMLEYLRDMAEVVANVKRLQQSELLT